MSDDAFPSLNSVSLIGTVHEEPRIMVRDRARSVTLAVKTRHDGEERVHRVVIQDEFLAQAVHPQLLSGAQIHVLGEIDYDEDGALVAVTNRRGSDVHVIGEAGARADRPAAPEREPSRAAVVPPAPVPVAVQAPREVQPPTPEPLAAECPAESAPAPDMARAEAPEPEPEAVRPPVRPAVAVPPRPPVGGLRGGLSSIASVSTESGDVPEEPGEPVAEEPPAAPPRAAVMVPRPAPMLAGRPMPPKAPTATPLAPRPAPPPGPRPPMPTGRPAMPVIPARKSLGPAPDDDDIPFAASMPSDFAACEGQPITGCGIVPRGFPHD